VTAIVTLRMFIVLKLHAKGVGHLDRGAAKTDPTTSGVDLDDSESMGTGKVFDLGDVTGCGSSRRG
jgi:hypothetical protein